MKIWKSTAEYQAWLNEQPDGRPLGFVPTMGALHQGHEALIKQARNSCTTVVVSIFVNPTQFNDPTDCESYPTPIEDDLRICEKYGVDGVFMPAKDDLYPDNYRFRVVESEYSKHLEGEYRPGHFDGVLTVVLKLFHIIRPTYAFFGEKDWQQYRLIKDMVEALFLPVSVVPCKTVRETDGLALSSRNVRLSPQARDRAPTFSKILREASDPQSATQELKELGFEVEYIDEFDGRRLGAVVLEGVRLIDNISLNELVPPSMAIGLNREEKL